MESQRRVDIRYAIRFPVKLTLGKRTVSLLTHDVSFRGVFLRTDAPPPLRQLVGVELVLPVGDRSLQLHGMTVRVVHPKNPSGYEAGIGVQFYAVDPVVRDAWELFIRHVEQNYPRSADQAQLALPRGFTPDPIRRRFERHTAVVRVAPPGARELEELYETGISQGHLFVPTLLVVEPGTRVIVNVDHPSTGQPFLIEAVVDARAVSPPSPEAGLSLTLQGLDQQVMVEFTDFMCGGVVIDDEVVLDPRA